MAAKCRGVGIILVGKCNLGESRESRVDVISHFLSLLPISSSFFCRVFMFDFVVRVLVTLN